MRTSTKKRRKEKAATYLRTARFWVIMQRVVVIP